MKKKNSVIFALAAFILIISIGSFIFHKGTFDNSSSDVGASCSSDLNNSSCSNNTNDVENSDFKSGSESANSISSDPEISRVTESEMREIVNDELVREILNTYIEIAPIMNKILYLQFDYDASNPHSDYFWINEGEKIYWYYPMINSKFKVLEDITCFSKQYFTPGVAKVNFDLSYEDVRTKSFIPYYKEIDGKLYMLNPEILNDIPNNKPLYPLPTKEQLAESTYIVKNTINMGLRERAYLEIHVPRFPSDEYICLDYMNGRWVFETLIGL